MNVLKLPEIILPLPRYIFICHTRFNLLFMTITWSRNNTLNFFNIL